VVNEKAFHWQDSLEGRGIDSATTYANIVSSAKKSFTFRRLWQVIVNPAKIRSTLDFCQETNMSQIPLISVFSRLEDPRNGPAQRHDLREMIVIALCTILCSAERWVDVAEWGEQ
jgi:hypothetical protein